MCTSLFTSVDHWLVDVAGVEGIDRVTVHAKHVRSFQLQRRSCSPHNHIHTGCTSTFSPMMASRLLSETTFAKTRCHARCTLLSRDTRHFQVTALRKFFTHMSVYHQAIQIGAGQGAVMPCGWEGNRRFGVRRRKGHAS